MAYTFGPVPSRRLGRSVGVNNIPPKYCTYACVYCQLGDPQHVTVTRRSFYNPEEIVAEVESNLEASPVDYVTIVPDGEPTLDVRIGTLIADLRSTLDRYNATRRGDAEPVRLAVITNGSLLFHDDVADALLPADWVSVKIDADDEPLWRTIDRPARALEFTTVLEGIKRFRRRFTGIAATETMLVDTLNTSEARAAGIAEIIADLDPNVAYISIPTRPPAESWVNAPEEETVLTVYRTFRDAGIPAELNIAHEEGEFVAGETISESILAITAVHPIREDDLRAMVARGDHPWSVVEQLVERDELIRRTYRGETFYVKRLKKRRRTHS